MQHWSTVSWAVGVVIAAGPGDSWPGMGVVSMEGRSGVRSGPETYRIGVMQNFVGW